jgi:hypothetical protein
VGTRIALNSGNRRTADLLQSCTLELATSVDPDDGAVRKGTDEDYDLDVRGE